jgi:HSP20 family protein
MINQRYDRNPLDSFLRMQEEIARTLNSQPGQPREHVSARVWTPAVDVYEDGHEIVIQVDLPGMTQEEIDIELTDDTLTIKGERKFADEDGREKYVRIERQYGAFQRSFTIGVPIKPDDVKASYRNGILELTLPKADQVKPKKVQVQVA